ncbi:unnamed protein product, partial [Discosporangium mesarthrocarpum]
RDIFGVQELRKVLVRLEDVEEGFRRGRAGGAGKVEGVGRGTPADGLGEGLLRRLVRGSRGLVGALVGARVIASKAYEQLSLACEDRNSLSLEGDSLKEEAKRLHASLEEESSARVSLLSQLNQAQEVQREAVDAAQGSAAQLRELQIAVRSIVSTLPDSLGGGWAGGNLPGVQARQSNGKANPTSRPDACIHRPSCISAAGSGLDPNPLGRSLGSDLGIAQHLSAGVAALVADRAARTEEILIMEEQLDKLSREREALQREGCEREGSHQGEMGELQLRWEAKLDAQEKETAKINAAEKQARDQLASALGDRNATANENARLLDELATQEKCASSLRDDLLVTEAGLRLLARACHPLLNHCREVLCQKRLLADFGVVAGAGREHAGEEWKGIVDGVKELSEALREDQGGTSITSSNDGSPGASPVWGTNGEARSGRRDRTWGQGLGPPPGDGGGGKQRRCCEGVGRV